VVDDQAYVTEFLSQELGQGGYRVAGAGDLESIERFLETSKPDSVLLDLCLDGFKGWDIFKGLKEREPDLQVLILTAYETSLNDPGTGEADGCAAKNFVALDRLKREISEILSMTSIRPVMESPEVIH
jgi:DNA-binding NtrC family response regulator